MQMSETNSSSQPSDAPSTHPDSLRTLTWESLARKLGESWREAQKVRDQKNSRIKEIDEKARRLAKEYKEVEDQLNERGKEILCDILDPKIKDLIVALDDGSYEKPSEVTTLDVIESTGFPMLMGEIMLRIEPVRPERPAADKHYVR
jgi:hypothetical protein